MMQQKVRIMQHGVLLLCRTTASPSSSVAMLTCPWLLTTYAITQGKGAE
jgi:hypothetical protein